MIKDTEDELFNRERSQGAQKMSKEGALYHYCSNDVFCSIIEDSTIWLSALTHSTDSMEGRLVGEIFSEIVSEDKNIESKVVYLQKIQDALLDFSPGFGFCLSKQGDVLSQWRGYADDAQGVSVGFNPVWLSGQPESINVPPALEEVIYDRDRQKEIIRALYVEIKKHIVNFDEVEDTELDTDEIGDVDGFIRNVNKAKLHRCLLQIHENTTFLIKSEGFRDEQEVRLISMCDAASKPVQYRSIGDKCVPFIPYKLPRSHRMIEKVFLGPKNNTSVSVVENMLKRYGFGDVEVVLSGIPYR